MPTSPPAAMRLRERSRSRPSSTASRSRTSPLSASTTPARTREAPTVERRLTRSRCRDALAAALMLAAVPAFAATRLDDLASPRQHVEMTAQWERRTGDAPGADERLAVVVDARDVDIRLNTAPW